MISLIKNKGFAFITTISLIFLLGCGNSELKTNTLCVTIDPQRYFLEQIVGDKFEVKSLVPSGANPESFDPAPSQMMALANSKAYFKIGFLGVENTLIDKIKKESKLNIFDCSTGIDIIEDCHAHENKTSDQHHHGHDGGDPHYWSSINSARNIVKNMYEAVVTLDSANKDVYTSNYMQLLLEINKTDSIIKSYLEKSESKAFIIYHPALSYFAREYNLEQLSIENEGKNPSPTQIKNLIDKAREEKIKAVFIQQEFDIKNAETIAKEIDATTYSIDLLSYNWHDEMISIAKSIAGKR